jgi:hypothetical protein
MLTDLLRVGQTYKSVVYSFGQQQPSKRLDGIFQQSRLSQKKSFHGQLFRRPAGWMPRKSPLRHHRFTIDLQSARLEIESEEFNQKITKIAEMGDRNVQYLPADWGSDGGRSGVKMQHELGGGIGMEIGREIGVGIDGEI